jgi:hypothetical protein
MRYFSNSLSACLRDLRRHLADVREHRVVRCVEEAVQPCLPVLHGRRDLAKRHAFGDVEVGIHQPRELRELRLIQVVLGHDNVELLDLAVLCVGPGVQAHVLLGRVGAVD